MDRYQIPLAFGKCGVLALHLLFVNEISVMNRGPALCLLPSKGLAAPRELPRLACHDIR
jgi:hypothetical protein